MGEDRMTRTLHAAHRRRNPDPEIVEERNEYLESLTDWKGKCAHCGAELTGTIAAVKAHRCPEYEASLGSSN